MEIVLSSIKKHILPPKKIHVSLLCHHDTVTFLPVTSQVFPKKHIFQPFHQKKSCRTTQLMPLPLFFRQGSGDLKPGAKEPPTNKSGVTKTAK